MVLWVWNKRKGQIEKIKCTQDGPSQDTCPISKIFPNTEELALVPPAHKVPLLLPVLRSHSFPELRARESANTSYKYTNTGTIGPMKIEFDKASL